MKRLDEVLTMISPKIRGLRTLNGFLRQADATWGGGLKGEMKK
ncbi:MULTISPECIES: hypothetical protein [Streptomyces]|nr:MULTISPECIES: hypothetical protein [Streptomyces]WSQ70062.1 hypothetical protein OG463_00570 [Streptomyces xinghaiensis]